MQDLCLARSQPQPFQSGLHLRLLPNSGVSLKGTGFEGGGSLPDFYFSHWNVSASPTGTNTDVPTYDGTNAQPPTTGFYIPNTSTSRWVSGDTGQPQNGKQFDQPPGHHYFNHTVCRPHAGAGIAWPCGFTGGGTSCDCPR